MNEIDIVKGAATLPKRATLKLAQIYCSVYHYIDKHNKEKTLMNKDYRAEAEKAVGLKFNPSGDKIVEGTKQDFAQTIGHLMELRDKSDDGEAKRMLSIAITQCQGAQMWAVKALTWKK